MDEAAGALRFEDAARLRDQLQAVERSLEKQRVLMADLADRDVVGLYREGPDLVVQVLSVVRGGKLQDSRSHPFHEQEFPDEETPLVVPVPLLRAEPRAGGDPRAGGAGRGADALADVLSERRGRRVRILTPQRGAKADLLEVAARNAEQGFRSWHEKDERRRAGARGAPARCTSAGRRAGWSATTSRTFQGALAVGSVVSFRTASRTRRTTAGTR